MKSNAQLIKSITSQTIRQKILDVIQPGYLQAVINNEINSFLNLILNDLLKQHQAQVLNRQPYERNQDSIPRNGYKPVSVWGFGQPMILDKPVTRKGSIHFPLLAAFKKAGRFLTSVLAASFWLKGTSTRATAHTIRQTFGVKMSPSDISNITNSLEPVITQWLSRNIPDNIRYLFLDASLSSCPSQGH